MRRAHRRVRGLPGGGSTSESARAGVEAYSAAIHSASSTRSAGTESSRTALGATSRSGGSSLSGREPDHDAVEALVAERDPHDRADRERLGRQRVVERPGEPARGGEGLDPGDHVPDRLTRWRPAGAESRP